MSEMMMAAGDANDRPTRFLQFDQDCPAIQVSMYTHKRTQNQSSAPPNEAKRKRRVFFFVNKKEAKKTLLIWVRAGENARAPD
jgi:hypothetical protein